MSRLTDISHRSQSLLVLFMLSIGLSAKVIIPHHQQDDTAGIMSPAYWNFWNDDEQARIDRDIQRYRQAEAVIFHENLEVGTTVEIEQLDHAFYFGASMFNYNQLGTPSCNQRYRELWGTLFNSATVPFYWKTFEMQPGRPRFREEYWDTEQYWNTLKSPKLQPHWRRPAPDPMVDYCLSRGVRVHGHPLIWGNRKWHHPDWIETFLLDSTERKVMNELLIEEATLSNYKDGDIFSEAYHQLTPRQLAERLPNMTERINRLFRERIACIANYYGDRISSWDVVNESSADYARGYFKSQEPLTKSVYGIMPGDYVFAAFDEAAQHFSKNVKLNINDYDTNQTYADWVKELLKRGARIDVVGSQMHLFNPKQCSDIAEGKELMTPAYVRAVMERLSTPGLPLHLSEITITSPSQDERGLITQAIIARNLYRLWFSQPAMEGITWWNVVDDCGAPGEPSFSGLFTRDMQPKPAYYALEELIHHEWMTRTQARVQQKGKICFRGFKGKYRLTWKDKKGKRQEMIYTLK